MSILAVNDIKIEVILFSYRWYKRVRFSMQKQGLQVFDANGNIVIDISDSLTRIIGGEHLAAMIPA
nr:MAG TPA: hypothetical protein [Caudoviricetes sp.]